MKDWRRERWRKLYLREAAQQRGLWPVVTRGVRDYLVRIAEDDGTLVDVQDGQGAVQALLKVLGCHDDERDFIQRAIGTLLIDGYLAHEGGRIWIVNLPEAQGDADLLDGGEPQRTPRGAPKSNADRQREHRERKRRERESALQAVTADPKTSRDTAQNSNENRNGEPVTSNVTSSRVLSQDLPSGSLEASQKNQPEEPTQISDARVGERNAAASNDSYETSVTEERNADPRNLADALKLPICIRAKVIADSESMAEWLEPHKWPEVIAVAEAFAKAFRQPKPILGQYWRDSGVRAVVALFAAGMMPGDLAAVCRAMPNEKYWKNPENTPGLAALTFDTVRRIRTTDPLAAPVSPVVAKALADREARKAQEGTP